MGLNLCLQQASTVLSRLVTLSAYRVARNADAGSQITARLASDSVHESMVGGERVEVADDPIVKWGKGEFKTPISSVSIASVEIEDSMIPLSENNEPLIDDIRLIAATIS